ncbi:unnamed protein product [Amoebophrya sp. A25]|nr:unnamed protein product [Amoebophrya sp. A25]|eukprot:GSA25T00000288001.1
MQTMSASSVKRIPLAPVPSTVSSTSPLSTMSSIFHDLGTQATVFIPTTSTSSLCAFFFVMVLLLFLLVSRCCAARFYDVLIIRMTRVWYREVLSRLDDGSSVLDVGIGTATALLRNGDYLRKKKIKVVGLDYDADYIELGKKQLVRENADLNIDLMCRSIYDISGIQRDLAATSVATRTCQEDAQAASKAYKFDVVYFSGSFSLLPDPVEALRLVKRHFLAESGRLYITQTFQRKHSPITERMKPLLRQLIRIDFGTLTYEKDLDKILEKSGLHVLSNEPIPGSVDTAYQVARIICLR